MGVAASGSPNAEQRFAKRFATDNHISSEYSSETHDVSDQGDRPARCKWSEAHPTNGCLLASCIASIDGLPGRSASPSDIWKIILKRGVTYENQSLAGMEGIMKVYISPDSSGLKELLDDTFGDTPDAEADKKKFFDSMAALEYETQIYTQILWPAVKHGKLHNVVQFLGGATACSLENMLAVVKDPAALRRNVAFMTGNGVRELGMQKGSRGDKFSRPAITQSSGESTARVKKLLPKYFNDWYDNHGPTFAYLITAPPSNPFSTLSTHLGAVRKASGPLDIMNYDIMSILFQIAMACCILNEIGVAHNDLHNGNILVERLPKPAYCVYVINQVPYIFHTQVIVRIYDFDRAYAPSLKRNSFLDDGACARNNQCNYIHPLKDLMKAVGYLGNPNTYSESSFAPGTREAAVDFLARVIGKDEKASADIITTWELSNFLLSKKTVNGKDTHPESFFKRTLRDPLTAAQLFGAALALPATSDTTKDLKPLGMYKSHGVTMGISLDETAAALIKSPRDGYMSPTPETFLATHVTPVVSKTHFHFPPHLEKMKRQKLAELYIDPKYGTLNTV